MRICSGSARLPETSTTISGNGAAAIPLTMAAKTSRVIGLAGTRLKIMLAMVPAPTRL